MDDTENVLNNLHANMDMTGYKMEDFKVVLCTILFANIRAVSPMYFK